jgi:beta-galactosidase
VLTRVPGLLYGGDYNPEQWSEEVWAEDAELMQQAGVNLVTVGVFSWALLEPQEGVYEFEWLDRVIQGLWARGIAVALATPTAAPPAWLVRAHPEVLPVTADGVRLEFGSRRHYCPSSPVIRKASVRIAEQLARRYGTHPAVALWHVNNEYACHFGACFCDVSAEHFRRWLGERYGSIGELNAVWGTAFWGQRYGDWSEIEPPRRTPASVNPTQALDWRRFCSDAFFECFDAERRVLAELAPGIPVTTNFMNTFKPLDYWKWGRSEDVVSLDSYPDPADPEAAVGAALNYDLMRSLRGAPWLLLEHAASAVNWRQINVPKRPGLMRLWAHQAVARGSDGVMFFQWRAARAGAEKFHSALLPHLGTASRGWKETLRLGEELRALAEVAGTSSQADVAFLFDWDNWWAVEGSDHPSQRLEYPRLVFSYYRPFYLANVPVDFAHPHDDLGRFRLVVAPNLYLATDAALAALFEYVTGGGVLLSGFFSGAVDDNDHVRVASGDDAARRLFGLRVDEFWPLMPGQEVPVSFGPRTTVSARDWSEWIELEGGQGVAHYDSGPLEGQPAVVRNRLGEGVAYYCSAGLDERGLAMLARGAREAARVDPVVVAPPGVEACLRGAFLFLLNHTDETVEIELPAAGAINMLRGTEVESPLRLGPLGVAVLRDPAA